MYPDPDATVTTESHPAEDGTGPNHHPLHGVRVLDISTVYAALISAMVLGDFAAHLLKVEHPAGDPARSHGASNNGHRLWWKVISRKKRCVTMTVGTAPLGKRHIRVGRRFAG